MIKRKILIDLEKHLDSDQMTVLIGPRQVGKTYLMDKLRRRLAGENKKTVWLNLDNDDDRKKFSSQAELLRYVELLSGTEKAYVFIDEVQRLENAGLFLKGIYDRRAPHKFIVSGSGSLELKAKLPESMAGRKQLFTVNPVSFQELVNFRTGYRYGAKLDEFLALETESGRRFLTEYLSFGGYPRVILAGTAAAKQREMQEIYRSFIDRDIRDLLRLDKTEALGNLLKILAAQIGSLVNVAELSSTLSLDVKTVRNYLWYLEQTFIIRKVSPYFRNKRSEITKSPLYYFTDLGLRNWLLGLFGLPDMPAPLAGYLLENFIFNRLKEELETLPAQINFWRTRDQAEVDFVLSLGLETIPVEVKYSRLTKPAVSRSLRSFIARYRPKRACVVHLGAKLARLIDDCHIDFLPFFAPPRL